MILITLSDATVSSFLVRDNPGLHSDQRFKKSSRQMLSLLSDWVDFTLFELRTHPTQPRQLVKHEVAVQDHRVHRLHQHIDLLLLAERHVLRHLFNFQVNQTDPILCRKAQSLMTFCLTIFLINYHMLQRISKRFL